MKKTFYLSIVLVLMFSFAFTSMAAEIREPSKKSGSLSITEEGIKNLYTGGNMISIGSDILGDLVLAGSVININGNVEDDIIAAGGTLVIRGNAGGNVRVVGGNILIEGVIEEDLLIGGGNITLSKSALIKGDLIIGGGNVLIESDVQGDLRIGGGQVMINSKIDGKVDAMVDELEIGPLAQLGGLKYKGAREAVIDEKAVITGEIVFDQIKGQIASKKSFFPGIFFGILTVAFLIKILTAIALGLVLVYLFASLTRKAIKGSLKDFWRNLAYGFAALILVPFLIILLLITIVGIWVAGVIAVFYALMILLGSALASIAFGSWLMKLIKKEDKYRVDWKVVLLGVIGLGLIGLIPILGWLTKLAFFLISLGALYRASYEGLVSRK